MPASPAPPFTRRYLRSGWLVSGCGRTAARDQRFWGRAIHVGGPEAARNWTLAEEEDRAKPLASSSPMRTAAGLACG
jgi:hypothetical protein